MKLIFFSLFLHQVYQVYYIVVSTYSSSIVFFLYRKTIKILFPKEVAERQHYQETLPDYRSVMSRDLSNSLEEVGLGKKKNTTTHKISAQIVSPNHYIKYNCNKPHGKMVFLSDKGS
jgi:hypothetical protein